MAWTTADPAPNWSTGRPWTATDDSWGRTRATPRAVHVLAGRYTARYAGVDVARHSMSAPPRAHTRPPGMSRDRWPTRPARRPKNGAVTATINGPTEMA